MSNNEEVLKAISDLRNQMQYNFLKVNKRLEGIENELRKINNISNKVWLN